MAVVGAYVRNNLVTMMMKTLLFLLSLVFSSSVYAAKPMGPESTHPNLLLNYCGIVKDISRESLEKKFGNSQQKSRTIKNIHTGKDDFIWELNWKDAKFVLYEIGVENRYLFLTSEIRSNTYLPKSLIGESRTRIVEILGEPDSIEDGTLKYLDEGMTGSNELEITLSQNKVNSVKCISYLD